MRWRDSKIETPEKDGQAVLAINNTGSALVWYAPEMGAKWAVMHLPGRGVTIAETLREWRWWCPIHELHRREHETLNPEYYGL